MKTRSRRSNKNIISNVRVVDDETGSDGAKIDRIISQLHTSESQVRVLCDTGNLVSLTSGDQFTLYDTAFVRNSDDFVSLAQQFQLYRVMAIKVDIYDIVPAVAGANGGSTFHATYATPPVFSFNNIVDGPDFRVVPPGMGKTTLYWSAHTLNERGFQPTASSALTGASPTDYGGIRFYAGAGTSGTNKYQIVVKAVVDFRGRV